MLSVNGIQLDNPTYGWLFRPESVPYSALELDSVGVTQSGRDGVIPVPSTFGAPTWPLQVNTPPSGWEALQALFATPELIVRRSDMPGREGVGRLLSSSIDRVFARNEWIDATFIVEFSAGSWRASTVTTATAPITSASVSVAPFSGLSAPVQDVTVRVGGAAAGVRVADSSGAWITFPDIAAGQYVRFHALTGRAYLTTADTWTGGTDISGQIDFGGPRDVFEVAPTFTSGQPGNRVGAVTVTTTSRTGASLDVRGRTAYRI